MHGIRGLLSSSRTGLNKLVCAHAQALSLTCVNLLVPHRPLECFFSSSGSFLHATKSSSIGSRRPQNATRLWRTVLPSCANLAIGVSPWIPIRTPIILQEVDASACHMEPNEDLGVQGSLRRFLEVSGFQVAVEPSMQPNQQCGTHLK